MEAGVIKDSSAGCGAGGAQAALAGYEYQLGVSVLVALRLMLITKSATRVTIEPSNDEDLEADLEPATPGRVVPTATMADGYRLIIQIKLRSTGPWTLADFEALLKRGKDRRPAREHLDDPRARYLLVTSAAAHGRAHDLLVSNLEEWPNPGVFPGSLRTTLPNTPEGRVGIWGMLSERQLELETSEILDLLRVPHGRQAECRARLREDAVRRMRASTPGVWTREDLLATIRACGGYLASAPELEAFVPPANYDEMTQRLSDRGAVVITGLSGTGKTWSALALCDEARRRHPRGLEVVNVPPSADPSTTRKLDAGPTLYYIEDPWGQYSLRSGSEAWSEQLPRLLREAGQDRQYVITSRTDVLGRAGASADLERWSILLDADQYRDGALARIYDKRMDLVASDLQSYALDFRGKALADLETPLELDLLLTYLADGPAQDEASPAFYHRIRELAHRDAVETVVKRTLETSGQSRCAAAIWALLATRSQVDRPQLMSLLRPLRRIEPSIAEALVREVDRLIATRHLRQPAQTISFAHPSVRNGFEQHLAERLEESRAGLGALLSALTHLDGPRQAWGLETAARILPAVAELLAQIGDPDDPFEPEADARSRIDAWLEEGLLDSEANFRAMLWLAADAGSASSTPSEFARWFIKGIRRGGEHFMDEWAPPVFHDAWLARVSADHRSAVIADRFVREQLPNENDTYPSDFVGRLDRIATGLTPAYIAAASTLIGASPSQPIAIVAEGAARDLEGYEQVLSLALVEIALLARDYERTGRTQTLAIADGERNVGFEESLQFDYEVDGYASGVLISTYVEAVRATGNWCALAEHPRASELGRFWAEEVARSKAPAFPEELRMILASTSGGADEDNAWDAIRAHWHPSFEADLQAQVLASPEEPRLRRSVLYCALVCAPHVLVRSLSQLAASPSLALGWLADFSEVSYLFGREACELEDPVVTALDPLHQEIFRALPGRKHEAGSVSPDALRLTISAAKTASAALLARIVPVIIASGGEAAPYVRRWLTQSQDAEPAKNAVEAAIAIEDDTLVALGLRHPRADAREAALLHLAPRHPDPLPTDMLGLVHDPGSRVRCALIRILRDRSHPDHRAVLEGMIADTWSNAQPMYNEEPSYPIAREAIDALSQYPELSDALGERLVTLAESTKDRLVGIDALNLAALRCGPEARRRMWRMAIADPPRWVCVDALHALTLAPVVEPEIIEALSAPNARLLLTLAPPLAVAATVLLTRQGSVGSVVPVLERVAQFSKRRALLLPAAITLSERDHDAAVRLLTLLDKDHPARRLLDPGHLLPRDALDDLGSVRIRRAVHDWLKDRVASD